MLKLFSARRACASLAGVSALALGLAGCGGGGSSNRNSSINNSLPDVPVTLLTSSNRITVVSARRPGVRQTVAITGLRAGEQLIGIDFRYPNTVTPAANSLYGLGNLNGSYQLYRFQAVTTSSATVTAVGTPFTLGVTLGIIAFDFNPNVDRIRLIDTVSGANFRLNPDTGAVAATDGTVAYAAGDAGAGISPRIAGVAYNNNDNSTTTTTTTLYGIDVARGTLVSVGDDFNGTGPDTGVSPNSGQLFTIATLSSQLGSGDVGFDITPNTGGAEGNRALVALAPTAGSTPRLYELNLTTGQFTGGAAINVPVSTGVIDIAVGGAGAIALPAG